MVGLLIGVWASTLTEQTLKVLDPSSVVIDECWAMYLIIVASPGAYLSWEVAVAAFLLFRVFDIIKPPPLKNLARLPGGWGIMLDDAGAALYTLLVMWVGGALFLTY